MSKLTSERYVGQDVYIQIPVQAQNEKMTYTLAQEYNGVLTTITRVKTLYAENGNLAGRIVEVAAAASRQGIPYSFDSRWTIPLIDYEVRPRW